MIRFGDPASMHEMMLDAGDETTESGLLNVRSPSSKMEGPMELKLLHDILATLEEYLAREKQSGCGNAIWMGGVDR